MKTIRKFPFRLTLISLIGVMILGAGISICRISQFGVDPFTSINTGVSETLGWSLSFYQGFFNVALFAVLILADRKNLRYIHVGAIFNMFLLGVMIENILRVSRKSTASGCGHSDRYAGLFTVYDCRSGNCALRCADPVHLRTFPPPFLRSTESHQRCHRNLCCFSLWRTVRHYNHHLHALYRPLHQLLEPQSLCSHCRTVRRKTYF